MTTPDPNPNPNSNPNPDPNPNPKPKAIYKSVKDRIKEAMESRVETEVEDFGFKSNLGKFTAPRAQSSQAPLLENADDWKAQCDVNDDHEGVSVKERPFPSEIAVVSGPGSLPDGVIWSCRQRQ